jgi:uncharacterized integral membrane protein
MITLFIVVVAVTVMVVFSVQNAAPVAVAFLSWKFEASLAVIIVLAVVTGILIGGVAASLWRLKRSIKDKKTNAPGPADNMRRS